jgi:acetolactate synthase-1/2/3 large subunit
MDGVDFILPWQAGEVVRLTAHADDDPTFPHTTLRGSLAPSLQLLADAPQTERPRNGADRAKEARQKALADLTGGRREGIDPHHNPAGGLGMHEVFGPLRAALGSEVALTTDIGFHKLYLAQYWDVPEPNGYLVANGLSAMGWSLPSAIAYKLSLADRPVVAVVGDGSLLMYAGELETLARVAPPSLVCVVLADASLSLIRAKAEDQGLTSTLNDFGAPDYAALARSFGLPSERAESAEQAVELIVAGLAREGPSVVEVPTAYAPYRAMR